MNKIWLTSDWHLGHDKQFVWEVRGFACVKDMNETIINRFNSVVSPEDDVYVLGDLTLGSHENIELIKQFNGKLHLVRGNHDTDVRWELYKELPNVVEMDNAIYFKYNKYHFYLSHYPSLTGNIDRESLRQMTLNCYGHTHQATEFFENNFFMYHVGCDTHNCYPVLLDSIILKMKDKMKEVID